MKFKAAAEATTNALFVASIVKIVFPLESVNTRLPETHLDPTSAIAPGACGSPGVATGGGIGAGWQVAATVPRNIERKRIAVKIIFNFFIFYLTSKRSYLNFVSLPHLQIVEKASNPQ